MPTSSKPRLILFLGVQLSGKSTLAEKVSARVGVPFLETDKVQERLFGKMPPMDWEQPEVQAQNDVRRRQTYECLFLIVELVLKSGGSAIIEMPHLGPREDQLKNLVTETGARFDIIWCYIGDDNEAEICRRAKGAGRLAPIKTSDYPRLKAKAQKPDLACLVLNTSQTREICLEQILKYLDQD
jgi:predicted kinase